MAAEPEMREDGRTAPLAIAGLVLGILWLGGVGSLIALMFGYTAMGQVKRGFYRHGRGLAVTAVVLGWVGLALVVLSILAGGLYVQSQFDQVRDLLNSSLYSGSY
jgi:hypothetical protein